MTNPYIQNFINTRQMAQSGTNSQGMNVQQMSNGMSVQNNIAAIKEYFKTDSYTANIRPESPEGYIVKENLLQSTGSSINSLAKTGKFFVDALNGKGTDYTVGRINDGARLLGSLGIAAALAANAKNPKAKMMEFVGFATWFASMSLWPKFVGNTIKATKGVDINQEYVDSYGRRKKFFEDAQYITWDLYKDKDLYKMGDKLGVPKNIENRKDAIKEKAKQVATQGNTLMMLTAGFATPITTALICNTLENPVSKAIETYQLNKAGKALAKLSETGLMAGSEKGMAQLGAILGTGKNARLDINASRQVREIFNQFEGTGIGDGVKKALGDFTSPVIHLEQKAKDGLRKSLVVGDDVLRTFSGGSDETFKLLQKALTVRPEAFERKMISGRTVLENGVVPIEGSVRRTLGRRLEVVEKLLKRRGKDVAIDKDGVLKAVVNNLTLESDKHKVISAPRKVIENLFLSAHDFVARKNIADRYARATIANVADSQTANHWENAPRQILKALGINQKTRKLIANDPIKAPEYIEQHLRELAKDKNKFSAVVKRVSEISERVVGRESKAAEQLQKAWQQIAEVSGKNSEGMPGLQSAIQGAVNQERTAIKNKVMSTQSSFFKPLLVLEKIKNPETRKEVVKELISGFGIDFWSNKGEHRGIKNAEGFKKFVKEALSPIKNILGEDRISRVKINLFYRKIKQPLSQIDGANRNFIGNATQNRSDWAVRVGKSFKDFIRDAATAQGIKNTWLNRVLFVAVPVVTLSLLAISQFGKKNKYNHDVYTVKGNE